MSDHAHDAVSLLQTLIRCNSVTPVEGGALTFLQSVLEPTTRKCSLPVTPWRTSGCRSGVAAAADDPRRVPAPPSRTPRTARW